MVDEERWVQNFSWENLKESNHLEVQGIDGRIIRWIFRKGYM